MLSTLLLSVLCFESAHRRGTVDTSNMCKDQHKHVRGASNLAKEEIGKVAIRKMGIEPLDEFLY